jgi:hypothetical protein
MLFKNQHQLIQVKHKRQRETSMNTQNRERMLKIRHEYMIPVVRMLQVRLEICHNLHKVSIRKGTQR